MYRNYIFDLYGTLIDIHTNENKPSLWKKLTELYACYGAVYSWRELKRTYFALVKEEEAALRQTGVAFPEIDLAGVFLRLLTEAKTRCGGCAIPDRDAWVQMIGYTFRVLSRERFGLYPHTLSTLGRLRKSGSRIWLLSNAQTIFTVPELSVTGLTPYFDDVFISSGHGIKKPQPDYLRVLMETHGMKPEETVMVGNEIASDMKIADACGIAGIYLNTGALSSEEILAQCREQGIRPRHMRVILSGDIGEIL